MVIDASAVLPALLDTGDHGTRVRGLMARDLVAAPDLLDLEVGAALRRLEAAGAVSTIRAQQALADLDELPIDRAPHRALLPRCWALRSTLTVYDAAYVALAEALLTADGRLARAPGPRCAIEPLA